MHAYTCLIIISPIKVYRVCCGPQSSDKRQATINSFYSGTRTSIISLFTRRSSSASVLSERRPSYQYGKRCSDASIISGRRSSVVDYRREMAFSPINEHDEETSIPQYETTIHLENTTNTIELEPSKCQRSNDVKEVNASTDQGSGLPEMLPS